MANIKVGQTFTRDRLTRMGGSSAPGSVTVTVTEIVNDYKYFWDDKVYPIGVRFRMDDTIYGTSYQSLPLDLFRNAWAS